MCNANESTPGREPLTLKFVGALVEQLGAQMYPSATATVAELISNAWDADARNVWVSIPLGTSWEPDHEILVLDDGHGMTRKQAQNRYLVVGRKRRLQDNGKTDGGRLVHGRKGIGKLAAFGTARVLDCYSVRDGEVTSFQLNYDEIRKSPPGSDCLLDENIDLEPLRTPNGSSLASGTRIRLSNLRLKRAIPEDQFMRSMSRRFSIDQTEMRVFINGEQLQRFDIPVAFRFPNRDHTPGDAVVIGDDGWGTETLPDGNEVRWWIGFTEKPLEAEYLRGISILGRKKMLQRPFMFQRAGGAQGQLGQEYIVGEVVAEWIDQGTDIEDDLIQTNRDQLQLEDDRLDALMTWGQRRIRWALSQRLSARNRKATELLNMPDIQDLLSDFTPSEQRVLKDIAENVFEIGELDDAQLREFVLELTNGYKDKAVRALIERVQVEDEDFQSSFWGLVREFSLIDARKNLSIIQARLETIERVDAAVKAGATEVPELHNVIKEFPWLLDPRWSLMGDEVDIGTLGEPYEPMRDETGNRIDFLFALQPTAPANLDELLVVEIKRGRKSDGTIHRASENEVNKFHSYVVNVQRHLTDTRTTVPRVSGLMIADRYSQRATNIKSSFEELRSVKLEFKTWGDVIENTRRLHTGWLKVTRGTTDTYASEEETPGP